MRAINTSTLYQKVYKTLAFTGRWLKIFGTPELRGVSIIYGKEKNGKTTFALKLAEFLSSLTKVLYVSAEEGTSYTFQEAVKRVNLNPNNRNLHFIDYEPIEEVLARLDTVKGKGHRILIIDNVTIYKDELRNGKVADIMKKYKNHWFIFIAHEEDNKPDGATAKLIKKLSNQVMRVEGNKVFVSGRCPGGEIIIDDNQSRLYHGQEEF